MKIYVEYAWLENFILDGVLLWLALRAGKTPIRVFRLCISAGLGGVFAIVFPLLALPFWAKYLLKFSVGFLLCLLAYPPIKRKKEWGRYALTVSFFFVFTFLFGGVLLGVFQEIFPSQKVPTLWVMLGFLIISIFIVYFIGKIYQKKKIYGFVYACRISNGKNLRKVDGFLDSGNTATWKGLPVCFLSPEIYYDVFAEEVLQWVGQVRDEMRIYTLGGEKVCVLQKGKLWVEYSENALEREVYFALSTNMIAREYKLIFSPNVLNEIDKEKTS